MALSQNSGRPVAEGAPGGSSSDPVTPSGHDGLQKESVIHINIARAFVQCWLSDSVPSGLHRNLF